MKFRRQRIDEQGVNLTPLIDVVFLLLIFFMVSTTFTKESRLELELPSAKGEPAQELPKQIEIVIGAKGQMQVNEQVLAESGVEALMAAIQKIGGGDNTIPIVITADAMTPHQAVITAMDAAGRLGFSRLSLTTQEPETAAGN